MFDGARAPPLQHFLFLLQSARRVQRVPSFHLGRSFHRANHSPLLLFLRYAEGNEVPVSGDGLLRFASLIAVDLAAPHLVGREGLWQFYLIRFTAKGQSRQKRRKNAQYWPCTPFGEKESCIFPLIPAEKGTATLLPPFFVFSENTVAFVLAGSIIRGAMCKALQFFIGAGVCPL